MTFTNDDLKRLKDHIAGVAQLGTYPLDKLSSLLSRLEAAESVCSEVKEGQPIDWDIFMAAYYAWCKVAGR